MKKTIVIGLAVVLVIAALTNPSKAAHKEMVKEVLTEKLSKSNEEKNKLVEGILQIGFIDGIVTTVLDEIIKVDNYLFFSLTKIKDDTKNKTIGIGAFGHVWIRLTEGDETLIKDLKVSKR
jgi:hypothetical protein